MFTYYNTPGMNSTQAIYDGYDLNLMYNSVDMAGVSTNLLSQEILAT